MSDPAPTSDPTLSQRRRWLKTLFIFSRKHLDYSFASKTDSALHKRLAWDTIAGRSTYFTTIEADRELSWVAFVMTAIAVLAVFRGGPQPLTLLVCAGATMLGLVIVLLTRKLRQVAFTGIPAADRYILVLKGRNHDTIIKEIEERRSAALSGLAVPDSGLSLRAYLRRLRWLVENDVLTAQDAAARQKQVAPESLATILPSLPAETVPVSFRQRRFGVAIDVELLTDRLTYRTAQLFDTTSSHSVCYRHLKEPSDVYDTDHRYLLTGLIVAWCAIAIFAWVSGTAHGHADGYYVGSIGMRRAIVDFGPALLAMAACAATVSMVTRVRYHEPYPGIRLLRDRHHDALLDAIEQRRVAAQRALANPDPALTFEEQMQLLSELRDREIINDEDHDRAAKRAASVCNNPQLDQPMAGQPQKARREAVH